MASIAPFVFLPDRRIVVCSQCRYACIGNEIERHLSGDQHKTLPSSARRPIAKAVRALQGIICEQSQLDEFAFPDPACAPIPILGPPWADGLACTGCIYVVRSIKKMKEHCRQDHGWINSRKKGGQKKHAEVPADPWREGVQCQRFFPTRKASRYFEVLQTTATNIPARQDGGDNRQRFSARQKDIGMAASIVGDSDLGLADAEPSTPSRASPSTATPNNWLQALTQRSALLDQSASRAIHGADEKLEPNPWLRRVGWAFHLADLMSEKHLARLRQSLQPPRQNEPVLQVLWESYTRVANKAREQVCGLDAGAATLFEMARDSETRKHTPFQPRMAKNSWVRYRAYTGQLLLYLYRTQTWQDEDRPQYELTPPQSDILGDLEGLLEPTDTEKGQAGPPVQKGSEEEDRLDELVAKLLLALFDHHYHSSPYESVVISGLAVMGIRDDNGWVDVSDYTMRYSAIIKILRIMVVARSITEMERDVMAKMAKGQDREEAKFSTEGLFERVRRRMDRFMLRASGHSRPSVMDWILSCRTYGMAISFSTPADGHIQWDDTRVSYKRVQFKMDDLREMLDKLIDETKALLGDALCLGIDPTTQAHVGFPDIPWDALEDDQSDTRLGHWFVLDERNPWPVSRAWLAERISKQPKLWHQWTAEPRAAGHQTIRPKASAALNKLVDQIRGRLLILMHIGGGGPGRSAEILNLRIWNTRQGGTRNIFIYHKMVCLVTKYHKGYLATDKLKVVYRFLPREIGELLVWYLWLVLPFWQAINSVAQQADCANPFLFSQNAVYGTMSKEQREEMQERDDASPEPLFGPSVYRSMASVGNEEDGDELEEEESGFRDGRHVTWSADKMRRLLKELTGRFIGVEVNIIAYRHIWIAISRRYMLGDSQVIAFKDKAAQGTEDKTIDLMTTHSSFTGDVVYAREAMSPFSTGSDRNAFEKESKRWHRFLGLGLMEGMMIGKRRLEPFEQDGDQARFKRQKRLAEVDLRGRLRQMLGDPEAQFRPGQERVLQAIHKGYSPVLQVVGTGSGKSLSFMLPAYCAGDGVTIVIVPLIALREDMVKRCDALQIRNLVWSPALAAAGSGTETASVVFVTPESAVHASFATYLRVLRARSRLDRIVMDECHMVLDSASPRSRFRPAFLRIGEMLADHGVQILLLTATLSPRDEANFFRHIQIERDSAIVFRSSTSRKNIAYIIHEVNVAEEEDVEDGLAQAVKQKLAELAQTFPSGKIIIYCGTTARTEALGERLDCPAYFSKAGTDNEKSEMLADWIHEGRVIAATNALGVGLDIPCIRAVLHVTPPRRMRDFAQESGRAGRDGQESISIIIRRRTGSSREDFEQHPTAVPRVESTRQARRRIKETRARAEAARKAIALEFVEDEMADYLETTFCRRAVIDETMDGDSREDGCDGDTEQLCDLCRDRQKAELEPSSEEEEGDLAILQDNLQKQAATSAAAQRSAKQARQREGQDWTTFAKMLPLAYGVCIMCAGPEEKLDEQWRHSQAECPILDLSNPEPALPGELQSILGMQRRIQKDVLGGGLEAYAGCRKCGLPQSLCDSWDEDPNDGGRFLPSRDRRECQFDGMLARIVTEAMVIHREICVKAILQLRNITREEMFAEDSFDTWYKWLGARTLWAGNETNNLCLLVSYLLRYIIVL